MRALLLRRGGSNSRPSGYEPDELPLLYFAMWGAKVRVDDFLSKHKMKKQDIILLFIVFSIYINFFY